MPTAEESRHEGSCFWCRTHRVLELCVEYGVKTETEYQYQFVGGIIEY